MATENLNSQNFFDIFPNPVLNNQLFVKTNNQKIPESIKFYNQLGQLIFEKNIDMGSLEKVITIELPDNLSKGIYTLKINSGVSEENFRITLL